MNADERRLKFHIVVLAKARTQVVVRAQRKFAALGAER